MTDIVELELDGGKYKIILSGARFEALRYGEPWRDLTGDNLVLFLTHEIESLRQQFIKLKEFKAYTHQRLDAMNIPYSVPESDHDKAGCRIGGRMDYVGSVSV